MMGSADIISPRGEEGQRKRVVRTSLCASLMAFGITATTPAMADMATALDLCLDRALSLDARVEAFEAAGWTRSTEMEIADLALAHAVLISGLNPEDPAGWGDSQNRADTIAANLRGGRGYDEVRLLVNGTEIVVVEPTRSGQNTCLYAGPAQDLAPVQTLLPEFPNYQIGSRRTIRGWPQYGQLIAYSMDDAVMDAFPEPLRYGAVFTVVLDLGEGVQP
jgi:hypothetical protein